MAKVVENHHNSGHGGRKGTTPHTNPGHRPGGKRAPRTETQTVKCRVRDTQHATQNTQNATRTDQEPGVERSAVDLGGAHHDGGHHEEEADEHSAEAKTVLEDGVAKLVGYKYGTREGEYNHTGEV